MGIWPANRPGIEIMTAKQIINGYIELCKPRIGLMVVVTAVIGFVIAAGPQTHWIQLPLLILGVLTVGSGASVLNQYLERDVDGRMLRTQNRPIPAGVIPGGHALMFGVYLTMGGVMTLLLINLLTAFLGLLTAYLYVLVYTPMKRITWLNTSIGAVPGALPIMGGWTAATGSIDAPAWALFAILWMWQHPHFYAIAWMYRDDYERGGFKMLPVVSADGASTFAHSLAFAIALIPVSLVPVYMGVSGYLYAAGATAIGVYFAVSAFFAWRTRSTADARGMMRASLVYWPALMVLLLIDLGL